MSNTFNVAFLADHPKRKEMAAKLEKLKRGLPRDPKELQRLKAMPPDEFRQMSAALSHAEIRQHEIKRETAIISAAMDKLADYATTTQMVDIVERLLNQKAR